MTVLEERRKNGQAKNLQKKTNTFTIIAINFVQEHLKTIVIRRSKQKEPLQ